MRGDAFKKMCASRISKLSRKLLYKRLLPHDTPSHTATTLVFAPHQDDETLGCGGTIIHKQNAGTQVTVAFMTDGTASHRQWMPATELKERRRAEAIDACNILGVSRGNIRFLDLPDGNLCMYERQAVDEVAAIIDSSHPEEIFIPYQHDGTPDHEATYRIVVAALENSGYAGRIFEYPVWVWNHWPWVRLEPAFKRDFLRTAAEAARKGFGSRILSRFRCGLHVDGVLSRKRAALARHRTQMTAIVTGSPWPTLAAVAGGDFLECFFQPFEVFRCAPVTLTTCHQ